MISKTAGTLTKHAAILGRSISVPEINEMEEPALSEYFHNVHSEKATENPTRWLKALGVGGGIGALTGGAIGASVGGPIGALIGGGAGGVVGLSGGALSKLVDDDNLAEAQYVSSLSLNDPIFKNRVARAKRSARLSEEAAMIDRRALHDHLLEATPKTVRLEHSYGNYY